MEKRNKSRNRSRNNFTFFKRCKSEPPVLSSSYGRPSVLE